MKHKIYGATSILILSISLLFGSEVYAVGNDKMPENIISQNLNNQQNISQKFQDLKNAVKSFNQELKIIAQENRSNEKVNSKNILGKLDNLQKELSLLSRNSQFSSAMNKTKINAVITEFDVILKPLENGLTKEGITQVQKDLGFFKTRNISEQYYGTFGKTTQEEIETFTNNKIKELEAEIKSLESLLNKQELQSTNAINSSATSPNNNKQINNYDSEISEINELKNSLNKLSITVIILGFLLVGLVLFCIYRIINLVEQQRKLAGLVKTNQNFIDTENFQIQMDEIFKTLNNLDTRLKKIERSNQNQAQNYSYTSNVTPVAATPQRAEPTFKPQPVTSQSYQPANLSNTNISLVSAYNINARSLSEQATTVSESEYTAEQRRLGRNIQPILESDSRGNYWIIAEGANEYLVPKAKMKVNEHNYLTISTFFNCSGYNPNSTNNFTLVKPAKVSSIGEKWELIEAGELQF
ncbi:MAG: hypothetical protein RLZZ507_477 [Cyanobacteriota bacterium]|jgi:hypothetical protein